MFTPDDVDRLARLARLALTREETELFARQLAGVLDYAAAVGAVDTHQAGTAPDAMPGETAMRDDVVQPSAGRDVFLAAAPAPDREAGLFKVPRVLG